MSRELADLKRRPTPASLLAQEKKAGYRERTPIDFSGPLFAETCIDVRSAGVAGDNHYHAEVNPPYSGRVPGSIPDLYLRKTVAAKLAAINQRIRGAGLELYLFDAWRPQAIQRYFHDLWFPQWLKARRPELTDEALALEVEKYWAAPTAGKSSPSPHSTGGAVDLTLRVRATGQALYMGGIFDDLTEKAWTDGFERQKPTSMSDEEAQSNRRLLYWLMNEAGFANNPTEWWHFSWGDQMWARLMGEKAAAYGACDPLGLDPP